MEKYLPVLAKTKLFAGQSGEQILSMLNCLGAAVHTHTKNSVVFSESETASYMGVILSGEAQVSKTDYNGNENIISRLFPSDLIAVSACFSPDKRIPFDITCASDCEILRLSIGNLIRPCCNACSFHIQLIKNILDVIADKNIKLSGKIDILTKRSIREKILSYLYSQAKKTKGKDFSINLSRQQMADFLSINRSALSRELCKMRDEGILDFDDNKFRLL